MAPPVSIGLQFVFWVFLLIPAFLISAYYVAFVGARLMGITASFPKSQVPVNRFAIIIPAHNEEQLIKEALTWCEAANYPKEKYRTIVVADNCSDRTAEIVKTTGVQCWKREDTNARGKGNAIQWAISQIQPGDFDAILILDADCLLDPDALLIFDQCLQSGHQVLQANHLSLETSTPLALVARIGQVLEYDFYYASKSRMGLFVPLVGSGMVFSKTLLADHPWRAGGLVEDVEFSLSLAERGIPITFVSNAWIRKPAEKSYDQFKVQRSRWAKGTAQLLAHGWRILVQGICQKSLFKLDCAWTVFSISRPLNLFHLFLTIFAAGALYYFSQLAFPYWAAGILAVTIAFHAFYYIIGIIAVGLTRDRALQLLRAPFAVAQLLFVTMKYTFFGKIRTWERTPRT